MGFDRLETEFEGIVAPDGEHIHFIDPSQKTPDIADDEWKPFVIETRVGLFNLTVHSAEGAEQPENKKFPAGSRVVGRISIDKDDNVSVHEYGLSEFN